MKTINFERMADAMDALMIAFLVLFVLTLSVAVLAKAIEVASVGIIFLVLAVFCGLAGIELGSRANNSNP